MKRITAWNHIKKNSIAALLFLILTSLTACSSPSETTDTTIPTTTIAQTTTALETTAANEVPADRTATATAYRAVLNGVYYDHVFPNNEPCDWTEGDDITQNQFAVYDVDQDGRDELILAYTTASMAGMVTMIYDFNSLTETAGETFREFPALTFFENGVIKADWSHNQGFAGEFWPYTLYQYNRESDQYDRIATVDAWDHTISETNFNGDSFPAEIDADGDGMVYYITPNDMPSPVDGPAYDQWYASYLGSAQPIEVPYKNLTEENIANIQ